MDEEQISQSIRRTYRIIIWVCTIIVIISILSIYISGKEP